jgi:ubiquinone/menaquinone biosynthesis C-methylase UbiE
MNFKDHFSTGSSSYAAFRPVYPAALFEWLAAQCREHDLAWDCATGNGQAAAGLAAHFIKVIATDASAQQIQSAKPRTGIEFRVTAAEESGLQNASVDMISVAQAVHWFDLGRFYAEAKRVLKPGGMIALWGYGVLVPPGTLNELLKHFYAQTVGSYWPAERVLIEDSYKGLAFPFEEMAVPDFSIDVRWNLPRLIAYLSTWSAVKRYIEENGKDPLITLEAGMRAEWQGTDGVRCSPETPITLKWPLFFRVGRHCPSAGF